MIMLLPVAFFLLMKYATLPTHHRLSAAIVSHDHSLFTRTLITRLQQSDFLQIIDSDSSTTRADNLLASGKINYIINIPEEFTYQLIRGLHPSISITADATNPNQNASVIAGIKALPSHVFDTDFKQQSMQNLIPTAAPFNVLSYARFNPNADNREFILPSLMGLLVLMTCMILVLCNANIWSSLLICLVQLNLIAGIIYLALGLPSIVSFIYLNCITLLFCLMNIFIFKLFKKSGNLNCIMLSMFYFVISFSFSGILLPNNALAEWSIYISQSLPLTHYNCLSHAIIIRQSLPI